MAAFPDPELVVRQAGVVTRWHAESGTLIEPSVELVARIFAAATALGLVAGWERRLAGDAGLQSHGFRFEWWATLTGRRGRDENLAWPREGMGERPADELWLRTFSEMGLEIEAGDL